MLTPRHPPYSATHPSFGHSAETGALTGGAIAAIVIIVLLFVGIIAWVLLKLIRARSLGLPTPGFKDFIPFMHSKSSAGAYSPTRPANGLFSFLKPSRGGYSGAGTRSVRTRGNFDDQAEGGGAWDARIEEGEEFAYHGAAKPVGVMPRGREQDLGAGMETERGRSRSRGEGADEYATPPVARNRGAELYMPKDGIPAENPFEQDLRRGRSDGFGDVGTQGGRTSIDSTKRSIFREGI